MSDLYLVPVGKQWVSEFERTVTNPVDTTDEGTPPELTDFEKVRLWGTTRSESTKKKSAFKSMESGDILLFSNRGKFFASGRIGRTFQSSEIGQWAWGNPNSEWVYTIHDYEEVEIPREELWNLLGYSSEYYVQGLSRVSESRIDELLQKYPSVEEAYQDLKGEVNEDETVEISEENQKNEIDSSEGLDNGIRDHVEIQWKLIQLGLDHGYDVYVAKNDQNQKYNEERLGDDCIDYLSLTGFSDAAISIIEYVDVIWLDGGYIVEMFEVESTTNIYSGILRMSDFIVRVPNLSVQMYIVAPEEDENRVRKQINRPTFQQILDRADYCSLDYLSFSLVRERYDLVQKAGPLQTVF